MVKANETLVNGNSDNQIEQNGYKNKHKGQSNAVGLNPVNQKVLFEVVLDLISEQRLNFITVFIAIQSFKAKRLSSGISIFFI